MSELLREPKVLERLEPNQDLLKALMTLKGRAGPELTAMIRSGARKVVDDIVRRLRPRVAQAFSGTRNRQRRSAYKAMQNFDWRATIRDDLKSFDVERNAIVAERLRFNSRTRRHLPWTIIVCVDQSGSMTEPVIYATVMASILSSLPSIRLRLVVFDTAVVDLSDRVEDPVDVLMSVQLGGGTNIGRAVTYCEGLVTDRTRTILVLLSDFCEGAPVAVLAAAVQRLARARVTVLGLAALDDRGMPDYE